MDILLLSFKLNLYIVVIVGFAATDYTIREGEQRLSVCADLNGQTAIPLELSVSAQGILHFNIVTAVA